MDPGDRGALLLICEGVNAMWEHVGALAVPELQHGLAGSGFGGPTLYMSTRTEVLPSHPILLFHGTSRWYAWGLLLV